MARHTAPQSAGRSRVAWALLAGFAAILCLAGGASRADAAGQVVTRGGTWLIAFLAVLLLPRPPLRRFMPLVLLVAAAVALPALQLVPLPPALWSALPGRQLLVEIGQVVRIGLPWRPLSIAPGETINALGSLIVPVTALLLMASVPPDRQRLPANGLLAIILGSCVIGAAEFSGAGFDHPLINDVNGEVSGLFANRNHFALFAVLGCAIAPQFAFTGRRSFRTALMLAAGMEILCILTLLAIGSRAGILLGPVGIVLGFAVVAPQVRRSLERSPGRSHVAPIAGAAGILFAIVAATVLAGRSVSLDRFISEGATAGLRGTIRPTLYRLVEVYFPSGTGFGTFDQAFRIHEQRQLLSPSYVNAAHNDFLQIVIEGGVLGALLLICAIGWWAWASLKAWRASDATLAKLGSSILFIVGAASVVDYPARTPLIMAVIAMAAFWLAQPPGKRPEPQGI